MDNLTKNNNSNLKEEITNMLKKSEPMLLSDVGKINTFSQSIGNIYGIVGLSASPFYSLTLDTGTARDPFVLPLTLINVAKHICQWITVIGKVTRIRQLLIVCEEVTDLNKERRKPDQNVSLHNSLSQQIIILDLIGFDLHLKHFKNFGTYMKDKICNLGLDPIQGFKFFDGNEKLPYINIVVHWDDIEVIENKPRNELNFFSDSNGNYSHLEQISNRLCFKADVKPKTSALIRVLVHHVSMPFHIDKHPTFCLVYVSYINRKALESKVWLVLKAEQVSCRELLVPNREYLIEFPTGTDKQYIDKFQKPLDKVFVSLNRELQDIFHHKAMFQTLQGCELPRSSRIFLTRNTEFSDFILTFCKDPFVSWFSVSEADYAGVDLVSFYGQVDSVTYDKELYCMSCCLCKRVKPREPIIKEPQCMNDNLWINPWKSNLGQVKDEPLELPSAKEGNKVMKKGVPGKLAQTIKLKDLVTGDLRHVYLKHSYIPNTLKLYSVTKGMILCITHLIRRKSASEKYYFITTLLSSFKVLSYNVNENLREEWGKYSLFLEKHLSQSKLWGTLESFHLTKLSITAKCSYCNAVAYKNSCSNMCSAPKGFNTSAYAIGWIQIVYNQIICVEKVVIKNLCVQKLLSIPENIWKAFLETAVEEEIVCFPSYQQFCKPEFSLNINELLEMYCNLSTQKGKCYISVRKFSSSPDEESLYFCIDVEPVNKRRLNKVADFVRKTYSG